MNEFFSCSSNDKGLYFFNCSLVTLIFLLILMSCLFIPNVFGVSSIRGVNSTSFVSRFVQYIYQWAVGISSSPFSSFIEAIDLARCIVFFSCIFNFTKKRSLYFDLLPCSLIIFWLVARAKTQFPRVQLALLSIDMSVG